MSEPRFFIAGATGYTGREVVRLARERDIETIAHVRPDSKSLGAWRARFEALGAEVDATAWDKEAMGTTMAARRPTHVFALLGTTRSRAREEERSSGRETSYDTIDYGLTMILYRAAERVGPRFVYLSSAGVPGREPSNAYLRARYRVERALVEGDVAYTIARPSIITGSDRDDARPAERAGAALLDGALAVVGSLGAKSVRERYRSTTNTQLAQALIRAALDPECERVIVASEDLR